MTKNLAFAYRACATLVFLGALAGDNFLALALAYMLLSISWSPPAGRALTERGWRDGDGRDGDR